MRRLVRYVLNRGRIAWKPVLPVVRPRLVIFDFDGTIADTFEAGFSILNKLAPEFGYRTLAREDIERARQMRTRQLMKFLQIPTHRIPSLARRGGQELAALIHTVDPLPDMAETLRELRRQGYELGVITSNTDENVLAFLRNHDLELFEFVRCSSKLLGKAHEIRSVLRARSLAPSDILFVGDETRDIEAAQKARVTMAAVSWGFNSRQSLESLKPEFIFDKPSELMAYLESLPPRSV